MTERELQLLGFEKQIQHGNDNLAESEYHYYTYEVSKGIELISNASDEVDELGQWHVEFFNSDPDIRFTEFGEVQALINLLESRKIKKNEG